MVSAWPRRLFCSSLDSSVYLPYPVAGADVDVLRLQILLVKHIKRLGWSRTLAGGGIVLDPEKPRGKNCFPHCRRCGGAQEQ